MKKIILFFVVIIIFLAGCEVIPFAINDVELSYSPNPAYDPYYTSAYGWTWDVKITLNENSGNNVEIGNFGPNGAACISIFLLNDYQVVDTFIYYKSDLEDWFGSTEILAYGSVSHNATFSTYSYDEGIYIEKYYLQAEDGSIITACDTLILKNNTKKGIK